MKSRIDFDLKIGIRFSYRNRIAILCSICGILFMPAFQSRIDFKMKTGIRL